MVLPAIWSIEHVGRRKSLLWGAAAQAVCAIVAGLTGHFTTDNADASPDVQQRGGNVLIAFAILHVSFYSLFWGPTPCESDFGSSSSLPYRTERGQRRSCKRWRC